MLLPAMTILMLGWTLSSPCYFAPLIISLESFSFKNMVNFSILQDSTSTTLLIAVVTISAMIVMFSKDYMEGETSVNKFTFLLLSFVASMLILISSGSMFSMMLGWDGLGVSSFFLVAYYQNNPTMGASLTTIFSNRIGDMFLMACLFSFLSEPSWFQDSTMKKTSIFLIFLSSITKSAQIPFSAWLPAAMAAPTPISALVHSSTLVTAGVLLMMRFVNHTTGISWITAAMGLATAAMAGAIALTESDMKKMIAMSTLSQLGLMFSSLAMNLTSLCLFHLINHAIFKSALFLSCGSMMASKGGGQETKLMSNMQIKPTTITTAMASCLSLMGTPFISGFFSKDPILEAASSLSSSESMAFTATCMMTSFYSMKLFFMITKQSKTNCSMWSLAEGKKMKESMMFLTSMNILMGGNLEKTIQFHQEITPSMEKIIGMFLIMSAVAMKSQTKTSEQNKLNKMIQLKTATVLSIPNKLASSKTVSLSDQSWNETITNKAIFSFNRTWQQSSIEHDIEGIKDQSHPKISVTKMLHEISPQGKTLKVSSFYTSPMNKSSLNSMH